jgi:hypothetical protein
MPGRAALITALILDRPMCEPCIVKKSGLSQLDLDATVAVIRPALQIHSAIARCRICGAVTTVLGINRPDRTVAT